MPALISVVAVAVAVPVVVLVVGTGTGDTDRLEGGTGEVEPFGFDPKVLQKITETKTKKAGEK